MRNKKGKHIRYHSSEDCVTLEELTLMNGRVGENVNVVSHLDGDEVLR